MAYEDGMNPLKRKQLAALEVETNLLRIQQLSQEHDDENWEFRSWLKQNAPDNIDGIVKALYSTDRAHITDGSFAINRYYPPLFRLQIRCIQSATGHLIESCGAAGRKNGLEV